MADILFHSSTLIAIPKTANPTPREIMTIQESSFQFKGDVKKLMGEKQFAIDAAVGSQEVSIKCKNGQLNPQALNDLFFNQTIATGGEKYVEKEQVTVTGAAATVAGGANFLENLGLVNKATGKVYQRVASAPAAGQYTVGAAGAYTFNATENTNVLLISYVQTDATLSSSITMANQLAGTTVSLQAIFHKKYRDGRQLNLRFFNVICPSIDFGFKLNDYAMPDFTLEVFEDPISGQVFKKSWTTA
jgi:hypothetical protein